MRIPIGIDPAGIQPGLKAVENLVDASMSRIQARINAVSGPNMRGGVGGGMSVMNRQGGQALGMLTGMGSLTTGLGIGAAVGGVALLEQGMSRAIRKAREFQTATLAIAATLGSIGTWKGDNGRPLSQGAQAQRNLWQAEKYRQTILERSAKNILTFDEQLQSFQSGLASGARKGLNPNQILKLTEQTAIVAKTLGLRGEQIANASRLLMGGGVNVARSTIGRALGIQNTDITTRQGPELARFLENKMRGFDQMQSQFENSIDGMISTLEAKIDVLSAKAGAKFMKGIAPTLKQIGMLSEPTREQFKSDAEYKKATADYQKQTKTMDTLVNAAAEGFNGLFNGVKAVVESDSFKTLLDILVKIAGISKQIMLAVIFSKIAGAVGAATGALQKFLALTGASGLTSTGGTMGRMGLKGGMPLDIAMSTLGIGGSTAGAARGMRGAGTSTSGRWANFGKGAVVPLEAGAGLIGAGYMATKREMVMDAVARAEAEVLGSRVTRATPALTKAQQYEKWLHQSRTMEAEAGVLRGRMPYLKGSALTSAQTRLASLEENMMATGTMMGTMPYGARMAGEASYVGKMGFRDRMGYQGRALMGGIQGRLPMGMMGMMGGQMVKEMGMGTFGNIAGSTIQGSSLGWMLSGNNPRMGLAAGAVGGLGAGIGNYFKSKSMEDVTKQTTPGEQLGMQLGGALKGGAMGFMAGNMVMPGIGGLVGAGVGAIGGALLDPFIASIEKAGEAAKASAAALDEMREKFPHAAKASDIREKISGVDAQIADIKSGKSSLSTRVLPSLEAQRKNLQKQLADVRQQGTFEGEENKLAGQMDKIKSEIELYSKYGGKGPTASKKLLELQTEYAKKDVLLNKGNIPVNFDEAAFSAAMKNKSNPNYQKYQEAFQKWSAKGTANEGKDYADYVSDLAAKKKANLQTAAMPDIIKQIETQGAIQRMGIGLGQQGLAAQGAGKKALAGYIGFKSDVYEKAMMYDKGMEDPAFKRYMAGTLKERKLDMQETYQGGVLGLKSNDLERRKLAIESTRLEQDTPIKMARLRLEAQEITISGEQAKLESQRLGLNAQKLDLQGQALTDDRAMIGINMGRNLQSRKRAMEEYPLNQQESQLNLQQAQMGQRQAEIAPALFYGGMGPVSEAASAIRYGVESEFAQKFDPQEYEDAYREKLNLEVEQMDINKQLAETNTKRAALGLDRIEEDYANSLVDLTMQMKGMSRSMEENGIAQKENLLAQKDNDLAKQGLDVKKTDLALKSKENELNQERIQEDTDIARQENKLKNQSLELQDKKQRREVNDMRDALKTIGASEGMPGVPNPIEAKLGGKGVPGGIGGGPIIPGMPLPGGGVIPGSMTDLGGGINGVQKIDMNGKTYTDAVGGYSILGAGEKSAFQDAMDTGAVGKALQIGNPMMTEKKFGDLSKLGTAGEAMGYENTAVNAAYAKPLSSKNDWRRVQELMDNGMTKEMASQQVINSNAKSAYQTEQATKQTGKVAAGGDTFNIPITITEANKMDANALRRDFESWLKDYCRTQKLKAGG
jgi:hypothetical protein